MGQDIHGFIEIYNYHNLNKWNHFININYLHRSYSSHGFLGGRTTYNAPPLKYQFLDIEAECSKVIEEEFLDGWVVKVIYPEDITNYNWKQPIKWDSGDITQAYDGLSNDFKAIFEILQVLGKHYGNKNVRMIYELD